MGTRSSTQMKLLFLARYTVGVGVILFGILAAICTWLNKKWGKLMGVITAAIILAYTIPFIFGMMRYMGVNTILYMVNIVLAVALVVFAFIPKKKSPKVEEQVNGTPS